MSLECFKGKHLHLAVRELFFLMACVQSKKEICYNFENSLKQKTEGEMFKYLYLKISEAFKKKSSGVV